MKNKNLKRNLLIGLAVLLSAGVAVFMLSSDENVVKNIKTKASKKEVALTEQQHKKLVDEILEKNSTKIDSNITRDEAAREDVDYDDKFFGCKKRVTISGADDICVENEDDVIYPIEITPAGDTQRERKQALKEIAYDSLEKILGTEGDPSAPYIDDLAGKNVCNILIIGNMEKASHQGDVIKILFCNDDGEVASLLKLTSGGMDDEGTEYLSWSSFLPLSGAYIDDSDQFSLEELKQRSKIPEYTFPTISYEDTISNLKSKFSNISIDSNEEELVSFTRDPFLCGTLMGYKIPITRANGTKDILYVTAFNNTAFTQKELDSYKREMLAREKIRMSLSEEQVEEFMKSKNENAMEDYIDKILPPNRNELEFERARIIEASK